MSKPKPLGLIASGRMVESPLLRFPLLARPLGPIVASSKRVASRYANALRAGHAAEVAELDDCRFILLQVAREDFDCTLERMLACSVDWHGRTVVLLDGERDTRVLERLKERGAATCSAGMAPPVDRPSMVVEGDEAACGLVRSWIETAHIHVIELKAGAKPLFAAGVNAGAALVTPVMDMALHSLREAGLGGAEAWRVLGYVVDSAIREHQAHGRKAWSRPGAAERKAQLEDQLATLKALDAGLAEFYRASWKAALELFGEPVEWLDAPGSGAKTASVG